MFQAHNFYETSVLLPGVVAWLCETSAVCDWGKDKLKLFLQGHY